MEEVVSEQPEEQIEETAAEEVKTNETADYLRDKVTNFVKMLIQELGESWLVLQKEVLQPDETEEDLRQLYKIHVDRTMKALTKEVCPDEQFMEGLNNIMVNLGQLRFSMENEKEKQMTIDQLIMCLRNIVDKVALVVMFSVSIGQIPPQVLNMGIDVTKIPIMVPKIASWAKESVTNLDKQVLLKIARYCNLFADVWFPVKEPEQNS